MLIPRENSMFQLASSDEYDSDRIDSDVEAELYSSLHHEVVPIETVSKASTSDKMNQNQSDSADEIIIISEDDESDDDIISRNVSNGTEERSFFIDNIGDINSLDSLNTLSKSSESPKKKRCKVTNLAVENEIGDAKKKSNVVANLLENIQVQKQPKKTKRKRRNKKNDSQNTTIVISDSDSDSYRDLSDLDESGIQYVHTNISSEGGLSHLNDSVTCLGVKEKQRQVDTISLDSDSEDDSSKFEFSFNSVSNVNGSSHDLWRINDTDLYRTNRRSAGRYHENAVSQCTNCNKKGHSARYCLDPKVYTCVICGGAHSYFRCMQRMCEKCLQFGHSGKFCLLPIDQFVCSICNMRGHLKQVCPDLWRRYHLTTSGEQIRRAKKMHQSGPIYCFNCGEQGHFGFQCNRRRIGNSLAILPAVVSYQHPLESLEMYMPERLPPNPPAPLVPALVPPPSVPLGEVNQSEGRSPAQSKRAQKKFQYLLKKRELQLQKKIEKRMKSNLQTGPQYTPKKTKHKRNDPRRPAEDVVNEIKGKINTTPETNRRLRARLKRKLQRVRRAEKRRLDAAAV